MQALSLILIYYFSNPVAVSEINKKEQTTQYQNKTQPHFSLKSPWEISGSSTKNANATSRAEREVGVQCSSQDLESK